MPLPYDSNQLNTRLLECLTKTSPQAVAFFKWMLSGENDYDGELALRGGALRDWLAAIYHSDLSTLIPNDIDGVIKGVPFVAIKQKYPRAKSIDATYPIIDIPLTSAASEESIGLELSRCRENFDLYLRRQANSADASVNSLYLKLSLSTQGVLQGELVDETEKGLLALRKRQVSCDHVDDSMKHITQDPVRLFRMVRIAGRLGFSLTSELDLLCSSDHLSFYAIHPWRFLTEIDKVFQDNRRVAIVQKIISTELLGKVFPCSKGEAKRGELLKVYVSRVGEEKNSTAFYREVFLYKRPELFAVLMLNNLLPIYNDSNKQHNLDEVIRDLMAFQLNFNLGCEPMRTVFEETQKLLKLSLNIYSKVRAGSKLEFADEKMLVSVRKVYSVCASVFQGDFSKVLKALSRQQKKQRQKRAKQVTTKLSLSMDEIFASLHKVAKAKFQVPAVRNFKGDDYLFLLAMSYAHGWGARESAALAQKAINLWFGGKMDASDLLRKVKAYLPKSVGGNKKNRKKNKSSSAKLFGRKLRACAFKGGVLFNGDHYKALSQCCDAQSKMSSRNDSKTHQQGFSELYTLAVSGHPYSQVLFATHPFLLGGGAPKGQFLFLDFLAKAASSGYPVAQGYLFVSCLLLKEKLPLIGLVSKFPDDWPSRLSDGLKTSLVKLHQWCQRQSAIETFVEQDQMRVLMETIVSLFCGKAEDISPDKKIASVGHLYYAENLSSQTMEVVDYKQSLLVQAKSRGFERLFDHFAALAKAGHPKGVYYILSPHAMLNLETNLQLIVARAPSLPNGNVNHSFVKIHVNQLLQKALPGDLAECFKKKISETLLSKKPGNAFILFVKLVKKALMTRLIKEVNDTFQSDAMYYLGLIYEELSEHDNALIYYKKSAYQGYALSQEKAGLALLAQKKYEEALPLLKIAANRGLDKAIKALDEHEGSIKVSFTKLSI